MAGSTPQPLVVFRVAVRLIYVTEGSAGLPCLATQGPNGGRGGVQLLRRERLQTVREVVRFCSVWVDDCAVGSDWLRGRGARDCRHLGF